jgi:hypothetical protein
LPPPGLHDIQECLISFDKAFADIDSLGFVLKAMLVLVIKFGSLWEPVLKSATDSNQQMAAMIKIVVVVMDV